MDKSNRHFVCLLNVLPELLFTLILRFFFIAVDQTDFCAIASAVVTLPLIAVMCWHDSLFSMFLVEVTHAVSN